MNIDSIKNGYVIDHITAGHAMNIYHFLNLDSMDCPIAIIKNASSKRMGKKDIIKIDIETDINLDILGFVDKDLTINVIKNGERVKKYNPELPETVKNIIKCKNPRCITSTEQELDHIFKLTDRKNNVYRCIYCETQAGKNK